jgi:hypothetical protein
MSAEAEEPRMAELTQEAARARSRLTSDIEALAYKVSPENLKQEAMEAGKAAVERWAERSKVFAKQHPVAVTTAVVCGALVYSMSNRTRVRLFLGVALGYAAIAMVRRNARSVAPRSLPRAAHPYRATPVIL